jgi:hypothetical protein
MDGFRRAIPFSMESSREMCSRWLREHGVAAAERVATMEVSRWVSLVMVARFASSEVQGQHDELASVLAKEHRQLDHDLLLPVSRAIRSRSHTARPDLRPRSCVLSAPLRDGIHPRCGQACHHPGAQAAG